MRIRNHTVGLLLTCLLGCAGDISSPANGPSDQPRVPEGPSGGPEGSVDAVDGPARSSAGLRLLTADQWRRSLQVVLDGRADTAGRYIQADAVHGFRNVGAASADPAFIRDFSATAWDTTTAVVATAFEDGSAWTGCTESAPANDPCVDAFLQLRAGRAWRRPPSTEELDALRVLTRASHERGGIAAALEDATLAILVSPNFLFRAELGTEGRYEGFELASRLSFFLWNHGPDDALFEAAAAGRLDDEAALGTELDRLLDAPQAEDGILTLFREYLGFESVGATPGMNPQLPSAMRREADALVRDVLFESEADIRAIYDWDLSYVDPLLAEHYGVAAPADGEHAVPSPDGRRGILGTGAFLTGRHPIQRGVRILKEFMCQELDEPPENFELPDESEGPDGPRTRRQVWEETTASRQCTGCHDSINGVGFTLEHYDLDGTYRELDNGLPIDPSGIAFGQVVRGLDELAIVLRESRETAECIVRHFHRYAAGTLARRLDRQDIDALVADLLDDDPLTLKRALRAYILSPAFLAAGELR